MQVEFNGKKEPSQNQMNVENGQESHEKNVENSGYNHPISERRRTVWTKVNEIWPMNKRLNLKLKVYY